LKQKKKMFLQTLNIEWGQIDPKDNRVKRNIRANLKENYNYTVTDLLL